MIKILFWGGNLIAVKCLKALLDYPDIKVVGVLPRECDDGSIVDPKAWNYSLAAFAKEKELPILKRIDLTQIKRLAPDYIISIQYDKILKKELITIPKVGCINLHFSPLPTGRGCRPIPWAIINAEKAGVTLHWIDEGVDTGPIISQLSWDVEASDTAYSLYMKAVQKGEELFKQSLAKLVSKKLPSKKQGKSGVSYYTAKTLLPQWIDWSASGEKISSVIRANDFPGYLGAKTTYNVLRGPKTGVEIKAPVIILADNSNSRCGAILKITSKYLEVKTQNGRIRVVCSRDKIAQGESFT